MKKVMILSIFLMMSGFALFAQAPPTPPENPSNGNGGPVGGGAPIGSGLVLLIAMAAGYGSKKVYNARKRLAE